MASTTCSRPSIAPTASRLTPSFRIRSTTAMARASIFRPAGSATTPPTPAMRSSATSTATRSSTSSRSTAVVSAATTSASTSAARRGLRPRRAMSRPPAPARGAPRACLSTSTTTTTSTLPPRIRGSTRTRSARSSCCVVMVRRWRPARVGCLPTPRCRTASMRRTSTVTGSPIWAWPSGPTSRAPSTSTTAQERPLACPRWKCPRLPAARRSTATRCSPTSTGTPSSKSSTTHQATWAGCTTSPRLI